jgi:predicted membrane protein
VVASLRQTKAILTGAVIGVILYGLNLGLVMAFWPQFLGDEPLVAFTHAVFGLVAAGAYRGLLRRKSAGSPAT